MVDYSSGKSVILGLPFHALVDDLMLGQQRRVSRASCVVDNELS